jgi:hypothetical protein
MTARLDLLTDAELADMTDRAYREAARDWREYLNLRARLGPHAKRAIRESAESAEAFWRTLRAEQVRRSG